MTNCKRKRTDKAKGATSDHEQSDREHLESQKRNKKTTTAPPKKPVKKKTMDGAGANKSRRKPAPVEVSLESESKKPLVQDFGVNIVWSSDLTWSLIGAIEDDIDIKQGLFPPPGQGPLKTNGKPKTDYYIALARIVFANDPVYRPEFARASKMPKGLSKWGDKVKNRLEKYVLNKMSSSKMGETGAGIEQEEDINMEVANAFTTKWAEIKATDPWYWRLRVLIGQRPNSIPIGISSNDSAINFGVLQTGENDEEIAGSRDEKLVTDNAIEDKASHSVIDDGDPGSDYNQAGDEQEEAEAKNEEINHSSDEYEYREHKVKMDHWGRKEPEDDESKKKKVSTAVKKSAGKKKSVPTAAKSTLAPGSNKANDAAKHFMAISIKEEETMKANLELKQAKVKVERQRVLADKEKIALKAKVKMDKERRKSEYQMRKMELDHQLALAQAGHTSYGDGPWNAGPSHQGYGSYASPSYSSSTPSTPDMYPSSSDFDSNFLRQVDQ
ncbi:hypothetical protein C8J56DRAFT_1078238 [Mycena floridula]|nr:hypothetical protein C8J56DRAFT_1078238 [Mycena floridula]